MSKRLSRIALGAVAATFMAAPALAEDLVIGLASEPTSIDPHFHNLGPNNAFGRHIYDRLINQGSNQELLPGLAESWFVTDDPTVWQFNLRQGVTWHDGEPFTAEDVAFTFERAPNVPNSPSGYGIYLAQITDVTIIDDYTVQVRTADPYPLMPNDLSTVAIVSAHAGAGATTSDYNSGEAAIGTGAYRFVEYVPGDRIVVEANPDHWSGAPEWDTVTFRPLTSAPARVAALLSGDVDLIAGVPTADIPQLADNPDVVLSQGVSNRVIYFHIDSSRDVTPMVTAKDGSEIPNPFLDVRVRRAISMAIDREAIVDEVMEGIAIPAGQLLPEGFFGVSEIIEVPEYDPEGARALLAEAGHPDGFRVVLHGPNDRYINDAAIVQAVAQMLTRVGLDTEVDTMPRSVFFGRATGNEETGSEFSLMLVGWGSGTGEASSPLKSLIATRDRARGFGASNRGRFSDAEIDGLIEEALRTVDDDARAALLARATELAMERVAIIPTHFQVNTWATRPGLAYIPRTDEYTMAENVVRSE